MLVSLAHTGQCAVMTLQSDIQACDLCAARFAQTATRHRPRPVVWFGTAPQILIAGQAPGARVHDSGRPFTDASGDRLRDWMGINDSVFYDRDQVAILPMAFCFPGYNAAGSDLPPPPVCATTWRRAALDHIGQVPLTILVGGYAQKWHLGTKDGVTACVTAWRAYAPRVFVLPHPSWRNTGWIRKNPWFETDLLPALRTQVQVALANATPVA